MNSPRLFPSSMFRASRPRHAFVLSKERLVYVGGDGRVSRGALPLTLHERALGADAFPTEKAGVPVASASVAGAASWLVEAAGGKIPAACLVVPDDFVRVLAVDVEDPVKNPKEADEILRWKFGKVFGDPSLALRLSWQSAGSKSRADKGDGFRVVAVAAPEEAAASWEAAFQPAGVRIGALETASLALSTLGQKAIGGDGFLVWADGETTTTAFFTNGLLSFLRTKSTSDPDEALQEIRLAASFVAGDSGVAEGALDTRAACAAGPVGSPVVARLRAFRAENGGSDPSPISRAALAPEVTVPLARGGDEDPAIILALATMAGEDT